MTDAECKKLCVDVGRGDPFLHVRRVRTQVAGHALPEWAGVLRMKSQVFSGATVTDCVAFEPSLAGLLESSLSLPPGAKIRVARLLPTEYELAVTHMSLDRLMRSCAVQFVPMECDNVIR